MKTSKKVLIIILISLCVLLVAGLAVCVLLVPAQTQEYYERFKELLTQPLPIIGVSSIVIISGAVAIISRTSFGKVMLNKMSNSYEKLSVDYNNKINELKEFTAKAELELAECKKEVDFYKEIITEVCNVVPNKKVKEIAEKINTYTSDNFLNEQKIAFLGAICGDFAQVDEIYQKLLNDWAELSDSEKVKLFEQYQEVKELYEKALAKKLELETEANNLKVEAVEEFKKFMDTWKWTPLIEKLLEIEQLWRTRKI